jgi:hypothetical protein
MPDRDKPLGKILYNPELDLRFGEFIGFFFSFSTQFDMFGLTLALLLTFKKRPGQSVLEKGIKCGGFFVPRKWTIAISQNVSCFMKQ